MNRLYIREITILSVLSLVTIGFILLTFFGDIFIISGTAFRDRDKVSLDSWIYHSGTAAPGKPISFNLHGNNTFIFFITSENPSNWTIYHEPLDTYNYSETKRIKGEFDPPSSDKWYFIIYNSPNINNGPIVVSYDIQYGNVVDISFVFFIILCIVLGGTLLGILIYQRKNDKSLSEIDA